MKAPYGGKRLFDLLLLAIVGIPAGLIGVACAIAVRATSPGPIFFLQERVGMNGEPFQVFKFRSMKDGDNPIIPDAAVITTVGKWLRRFSLDELPQLLNVARGDMSVVGPRPTLAYQVERYTEHQRQRLNVRPGLTGWAQINGRNALSWDRRIELDIEYVQQQSIGFDLRILAGTVGTVLTGYGAEGHAADDPLSTPGETS